VHAAVDGPRLPDDWVYEQCASVASALVERVRYGISSADDAREALREIADELVDVYNADRLAWLASHLGNVAIVAEACADLDVSPDTDTFTRIRLGQCEAISRIAGALIDACEFEADRREEGDADAESA
jgi:hypothetical protein